MIVQERFYLQQLAITSRKFNAAVFWSRPSFYLPAMRSLQRYRYGAVRRQRRHSTGHFL